MHIIWSFRVFGPAAAFPNIKNMSSIGAPIFPSDPRTRLPTTNFYRPRTGGKVVSLTDVRLFFLLNLHFQPLVIGGHFLQDCLRKIFARFLEYLIRFFFRFARVDGDVIRI